jgi:hypothetical protein
MDERVLFSSKAVEVGEWGEEKEMKMVIEVR